MGAVYLKLLSHDHLRTLTPLTIITHTIIITLLSIIIGLSNGNKQWIETLAQSQSGQVQCSNRRIFLIKVEYMTRYHYK